jgi:rhomboid protease GluP
MGDTAQVDGDRMSYENQNARARIRQPSQYGPVTIALCVVFGVVFLIESYVDGGGLWNITPRTLGELGGNAPVLTLGQGELWRLVTAALMHGGLLHIAFNTYAMLIIGSAIERTLGPGWVLGPFAFSGITGSALSAYANPSNVVAIGASGGIFGLVAMAAAISYLAPRLAGFSRSVLVQWLVFALALGVVAGFDNWGHAGGIVGGGLCALVAAALKQQPMIVRKIGMAGGAVGVIVMVVSVVFAVRSYLAG